MAMYRASARMLPIVLNYLPHSLSKLCLELFHLVAIGLPVAASPDRRQQRHSTTGYTRQLSQQQQQQQLVNGSSRLGRLQAEQPQDGHTQQQPLQAEQQQQQQDVVQPAALDSSSAMSCTASMSQPHQVAAAAAAAEQSTGAEVATAAHDMQAQAAATTADSNISSTARSSSLHNPQASSSSSSGISVRLTQLPLQQLRHLELEECCVDDAALTAILTAATGLRTLELAGGVVCHIVKGAAAALRVKYWLESHSNA
jgi:hypothetical protein